MRNFILFIRRFFNLILFLALEVVCIILIGHSKTMQGNDITSSANTVAGLMYKKHNDVVYYFGLGRMNDSLMNENARLRKLIEGVRSTDTLKDFSVRKPITVGDTSKHIVHYADYTYLSARVINNSISAANNFITINRGSDNGVEKGMAVISGTGIVGKVEHVSAHYASIRSILGVKQPVSAKLKDGTNGLVTWDNERPDMLIMKDVPQQVKVNKGDSVYTTSFSFFPSDVLIGVVYGRETVKKNNFQILHIQSSTNFRNLQYVYVIPNKMDAERKALEEAVKTK